MILKHKTEELILSWKNVYLLMLSTWWWLHTVCWRSLVHFTHVTWLHIVFQKVIKVVTQCYEIKYDHARDSDTSVWVATGHIQSFGLSSIPNNSKLPLMSQSFLHVQSAYKNLLLFFNTLPDRNTNIDIITEKKITIFSGAEKQETQKHKHCYK